MRRDDWRLLLTYLPSLIIAAALLGVLVWRFWPAPEKVSGEELYRAHFVPYPNVVAPINPEVPAGARSLRERAYQAYESYDYGQADILLGKLPASDTTQFYRGMIAMIKDRFAQARSLLAPLAKEEGVAFHEAAEWYEVLLLLREEDLEKARKQLHMIASEPSHPFRERALRLLDDI